MLLQNGSLEERERERVRTISAGMLRVSPQGDEHNLRFVSPCRCILLLLDDETLAGMVPRERRFLAGERVRSIARELARELSRGIDTCSPLSLQATSLELLACAEPATRERQHPAWLSRIRAALHDSAASPPDAITLAADLGLHPVYVARVFRRHFGCGLGEYARLVRARRACEQIVQSRQNLAQVALEAGFSDQAHLTRTLRWWLGITPAELRRTRSCWLEVARVQDAARRMVYRQMR
jgi:AraC family transcriptional regulator